MEFVNFSIAKKLKDLGYNTPFFFFYRTDDQLIHHAMVGKPLVYGENVDNEVVIAPTISQVLKWLREEKKIAINIEFIPYVWQYKIFDMSFESRFEPCGITLFSDYEEAALAGIEYTLDNLI